MKTKLRLSNLTLAAAGAVMGLGAYLASLRPPLVPDDLHYLDRSLSQLDAAAPALTTWLGHTFQVIGGFMFASGLLTFYIAVTAFRTRARGAAFVTAIAGATSVGGMAVVNFLIDSHDKWHLLLLALLWALAFAFYRLEGAGLRAQRTVVVGPSQPVPAPGAGARP